MGEKAAAGRMVTFDGKRYWVKEPPDFIDTPLDSEIFHDPVPWSMEDWRSIALREWVSDQAFRRLREQTLIVDITNC